MSRLYRLLLVPLVLFAGGCVRLSENHPLTAIAQNEAMKLQAGDVIYVTTLVNTAAAGTRGTYPPLTIQDVIALRLVDPDAGAVLRPNEAALLGTTLTTLVNDRTTDEYRDLLTPANEARLWNAFIAGLSVRRHASGLPELAFSPKLACDALGETESAKKLQRVFFSPDNDEGECPVAEREVRGVSAEPGGLFSIRKDTTLVGQSYVNAGEHPTPTSGRVEVYRGGASMRSPKAGEERWTLAEWQAAGICASGQEGEQQIQRVLLRHTLFSLRVVESGRLSVGSEGPGRRKALHPVKDLPLDTLSRDSLNYLFPGDVDAIQWSAPVSARFRAACKSN